MRYHPMLSRLLLLCAVLLLGGCGSPVTYSSGPSLVIQYETPEEAQRREEGRRDREAARQEVAAFEAAKQAPTPAARGMAGPGTDKRRTDRPGPAALRIDEPRPLVDVR